MKKCNVAVVGATGAVGESLLSILAERKFPVENIYALASERSAGTSVMYGNKPITVENLADFDFSKVEIGLFSAGGSISEEYAPKAADAGCVVIDNTSCFRYEDDIPLVVTEVNPHCLADYRNRNIIANPNCSTMQMVVAVKPIHDAAGIRRISVATYQAVSGAGRAAVEELARQTAALLNGRPPEAEVFPSQIAFNALPHIDKFLDNGYTREEMKMSWETCKILGRYGPSGLQPAAVRLSATCTRVPVLEGHTESVLALTTRTASVGEARDAFDNFGTELAGMGLPSAPQRLIVVHDDPFRPQPRLDRDAEDGMATSVGRLRADQTLEHAVKYLLVSHNTKMGAAKGAVLTAEYLYQQGYV